MGSRVATPMAADRRRLFQIIAILAALFAYSTIVVGGTVRSMGAGLACPDWPLCHGTIVPNLADPLIAIEYTHRLAAALTSLFLFTTMLLALLWFRHEIRIVTLSVMVVSVLATQVAIGALTITSRLDPLVVTTHLALGTATFGFSLILAVVSLWPAAAPAPPNG
jgi:heme A synthase